MIAEPVLLVVGSVGIAASIYGEYLYWRNGHWSVRSSEPRMSRRWPEANAPSFHG